MKSKKIKNALLLVLTLTAVAAASVAITFAAVQSSLGSEENTFTNETISVELTEVKWDNDPASNGTDAGDVIDENDPDAKAGLGEEKAKSYSVGMEIPKNPKLTNISDTANPSNTAPAEWVAMTVEYSITVNGAKKVFTSYDQFAAAIATVSSDKGGTFNSAWTGNGTKTVFFYNSTLNNYASTETLFDKVTINNITPNASGEYTFTVGTETVKTDALPQFNITLNGYAVQADGISNVEAAKAAFVDVIPEWENA